MDEPNDELENHQDNEQDREVPDLESVLLNVVTDVKLPVFHACSLYQYFVGADHL